MNRVACAITYWKKITQRHMTKKVVTLGLNEVVFV